MYADVEDKVEIETVTLTEERDEAAVKVRFCDGW